MGKDIHDGLTRKEGVITWLPLLLLQCILLLIMGNYSSTLTIEEIGVGQGRTAKVLVLSGSGLPKAGVEWASETRMVTTWYPGNGEEASQQVLGPAELPTSMSGVWAITMLSRTPAFLTDENGTNPITYPHTLREIIDSMWRGGHRLRVTWAVTDQKRNKKDNPFPESDFALDNVNAKVIREGRIKKFSCNFRRMQDIDWTLDFEWLGRGGVKRTPINTRAESVLSELQQMQTEANAVLAKIDSRFRATKRTVMKSTSYLTLGQLEAFANLPNALSKSMFRSMTRLVNQAKEISSLISKVNNIPNDIANNANNFAINTVAIANSMNDESGRIPLELMASKNKISTMVNGFVYVHQACDASVLLARRATSYIAFAEKQKRNVPGTASNNGQRKNGADTTQGVLTVHITKDGDTPIRLSLKYYSSPDFGDLILKANRLPIYQTSFKPGKLLIVPALSEKNKL